MEKDSEIRKNARGKQIIDSDLKNSANRRDDDDYYVGKTPNKKDVRRSKRPRIIRRFPKDQKTGKSWKIFRTGEMPKAKNQFVQMVVTVAWSKRNFTKINRGYSSKKLTSKVSENDMFMEAFFNSKSNLGFSPTSYRVIERHYIYYKYY
jgi:hypothetical protein